VQVAFVHLSAQVSGLEPDLERLPAAGLDRDQVEPLVIREKLSALDEARVMMVKPASFGLDTCAGDRRVKD
jgi:hypothetical protein